MELNEVLYLDQIQYYVIAVLRNKYLKICLTDYYNFRRLLNNSYLRF